MPRPPSPPQRGDIPIDELESLDNLLGRFGGQMREGYFGILANSPPLGWRLASLGRACRQRGNHEGTYSHHDREFVDQIMMQTMERVPPPAHQRRAVGRGPGGGDRRDPCGPRGRGADR